MKKILAILTTILLLPIVYAAPFSINGDCVYREYADGDVLMGYTRNNSDTCLPYYQGRSTTRDDPGEPGDDPEDEPNGDLELTFKAWYPKYRDDYVEYVFVCEGVRENALVSWVYGDGHVLNDITNRDTFHRYFLTGESVEYEVSCSSNGETAKINIEIPELE